MPLPPALLDELSGVFGDRLSMAAAVREQHGRDESHFAPRPPEAVVFARSTAEVSATVAACVRHGVPVIPFGAGTSVEGQICAVRGGVTIDFSQMNAVLEVRPQDLDVTVQPGVTRKLLNEYLRDTGLFFPVDPGADASLGGMAATRASGTNAVRYGTMRDNVVALEVVLADGRVIRTGTRARKSSAGYDLTRLFVGSEGTLGIITELTLKVYGIPEAISAAVCPFPNVAAAINTVIATIQAGIPVARVEFLDDVMMAGINTYSKLNHPVMPHLFFEFHGSEAGVAEQADAVKAIAAEFGGNQFIWTSGTEERSRLWAARHAAYYASLALRPGCRGVTTDVCVPISRLAECIVETRADYDASGLIAPMVGHVGDGNFHSVILIDPAKPEEEAIALDLNRRLVARAQRLGGTCTGEHGIGIGRLEFMEAEWGEGLDVMRAIKRALDPRDLMNPGKMVAM